MRERDERHALIESCSEERRQIAAMGASQVALRSSSTRTGAHTRCAALDYYTAHSTHTQRGAPTRPVSSHTRHLLREARREQPREVVRREESRPKDSLSRVFKCREKQTRREAHGVLLDVRERVLVVSLFEHATRCHERVARRDVHVRGCITSGMRLADGRVPVHVFFDTPCIIGAAFAARLPVRV